MFSVAAKKFSRFPCINLVRTVYGESRIGNRDVVGHGCNSSNVYKDDAHFPFPAIRFGENTPYIAALRVKEKGHWRNLCCEEKKVLYRASFCQTYAEFQHFTGAWKFCLAWALLIIGCACWLQIFYHFCVQDTLPESLKYENQKLQLRRMIEIRVNNIDGISSEWNYDEDNWTYLVPETLKRDYPHMGVVDEPIEKKKDMTKFT